VPGRRIALATAAIGALLAAAACSSPPNGSSTDVGTSRSGVRWVVSLGDSYISGEGARWAGNTDGSPKQVDALGPFAYGRQRHHENARDCDRAIRPEVEIDYADLRGKDLACSGAETATTTDGASVTPGVDFHHRGRSAGQALQLERFASIHHVTAVVLSIGGNNFSFATVLTRCVEDFLKSSVGAHTYCSEDPALAAYFSPSHVADVQRQIEGAITNITTAMRRAGSSPSDYRIVVQTYPSPVPPGDRFRYPPTFAARFQLGGCPFYDRDATWANSTVLPAINGAVRKAVAASGDHNMTLLDLSRAFAGHRLCERGSAQLQESGLASWRSPGAASALEWVNAVYLDATPWRIQESAHPNYWGTAAERSCLRQVIMHPPVARVSCVRDGTAMSGHEPKMTLTG
jgi:hypothetical protein